MQLQLKPSQSIVFDGVFDGDSLANRLSCR